MESKVDMDDTVWYFAIGSMMNPISLAMRDLKPIESYPAKVLDHALKFFGKAGMAEAVPVEGASFHGVLHKMTPNDMASLDAVEVVYSRTKCTAVLYDSRTIAATIYCRTQTDNSPGFEESPAVSERYLDLLISGAQHFGVDQEHIAFLRSIPIIPRKNPNDFQKLDIPENMPIWEKDAISLGDGKDGRPVYIGVNGKVCEYKGDSSFHLHNIYCGRLAGKNVELFISKGLYEPKYGTHDTLDEFTREHCAYIEDTMMGNGHIVVVATFPQMYSDDDRSPPNMNNASETDDGVDV